MRSEAWRPAAAACNRLPREAREVARQALRPGCEELAVRIRVMPEMEARPRVKNRHGGAPRGERPASWDARRLARRLACRVMCTPHGCSAEHPNVSRRSAHPSFGVSEATMQKLGRKCAAGRKECVLLMMSSEEAASAVAVIVPSPLAGEGGSVMQRAMMGEGFVAAATPHPLGGLGPPLCPLPQGARAREAGTARFGETKPTIICPSVVPARGTPRRWRRGDPVAGTHDHRRWLWVPALPSLSRGSAGTTIAWSGRSTNQEVYEMAAGAISLFPDCYLQ